MDDAYTIMAFGPHQNFTNSTDPFHCVLLFSDSLMGKFGAVKEPKTFINFWFFKDFTWTGPLSLVFFLSQLVPLLKEYCLDFQ